MILVQRRDIPAGERQYDIGHTASGQDVDDLIEALQSNDSATRRNAALGLGALGEWRGVGPLIRVLADPAQGVRETAANALVMVGTPAVEPLIDLLERREAGYRLAREAPGEGLTQVDLLGGPENIPPSKRTLRHSGGIRQHDMLGGPADIREVGARRARDEEEELAQHDAFGGPEELKRAGGRNAIDREEEITQHDLLGGPEDAREYRALFPGATRAGVVPERIPADRELRRAYAVVILGEIADPRAEEALGRSLNDIDLTVRKAAEDAMARFREKRGMATTVPPAPR